MIDPHQVVIEVSTFHGQDGLLTPKTRASRRMRRPGAVSAFCVKSCYASTILVFWGQFVPKIQPKVLKATHHWLTLQL